MLFVIYELDNIHSVETRQIKLTIVTLLSVLIIHLVSGYHTTSCYWVMLFDTPFTAV